MPNSKSRTSGGIASATVQDFSDARVLEHCTKVTSSSLAEALVGERRRCR